MALTIALPPKSEARLSQRARAVNQDLAAYASEVLRRWVAAPGASARGTG